MDKKRIILNKKENIDYKNDKIKNEIVKIIYK
jgi:hypothetical protein